MIIVNYKLAMQAESSGPAWLQAIAGLFEGRASALFVVLAGIGVTLLTSKARSSMNGELIHQNRNSFYRRAAFLFIAGMLLLLMDWSADIFHYYAVFMLVAAVLITVSDNIILGMFSLSHYIGHVVTGLGLLQITGYLENRSLAFAMMYGTSYFIIAIIFSYTWRKWMTRGPIELMMRKLC
ncbi:hypothetical protein [Paenibacillus sp. GCM10027626]|uniref:hypothetical protein n=1 Tax=Paenibacillus sp. GCM10027626 TaxID=3273411 RepID=UPI00363A60D5